MNPEEITSAYGVEAERLAEWGARIDSYEEMGAEARPLGSRLVFRSMVLAWLTGMAEYSRPETVAAATALVRERLAAYDAAEDEALRRQRGGAL